MNTRNYRKIYNIKTHQIPIFNDFYLQLSLPNPLKPGVKSRMKMYLGQRQQAMLQLHLSDQQFFLPTKARLLLEIWRYILNNKNHCQGEL